MSREPIISRSGQLGVYEPPSVSNPYENADTLPPGASRMQQLIGGKAYQEYQLNKRLANDQRAYEFDMWNAQNAYNDPSAQMQRYLAAGFTPAAAANAVLSQGSEAAPYSMGSAPSVQGNDFGSGLATVGSAIQAFSQGGGNIAGMIATLIDNKTRAKRNGLQLRELEANIDNIKSITNVNKWQAKKIDREVQRFDHLTPIEVQKGRAQISQIRADIDKIKQETATSKSLENLQNAEVGEVVERTNSVKYDNVAKAFRALMVTTFGFDPNSTLVNGCLGAILSGHGIEVMDAISKFISDGVGDAPSIIQSVLESLFGDDDGHGAVEELLGNVGKTIEGSASAGLDSAKQQVFSTLALLKLLLSGGL